MAFVIAGERSGVGKTTVTLMLLATLAQRNWKIQSFKVGPDYIDPMFHTYVTGRACRNLDPVLTSETYVQECFRQNLAGVKGALVEGVMGLFDGATGEEDFASTAHIARLLNLPILLVLDCSRLSRSVAAIAHGYCSFDPRIQLAGVVLNRVGSDRHLELLKDALEPLNLPILGILRRQDDIAIPDRHLGLIPTTELPQLDQLIDRLAALGEACLDWAQLLPLVVVESDGRAGEPRSIHSLPPTPYPLSPISYPLPPTRIAIAHDAAFSFYYADNLALLERLGAELVSWSPMRDLQLPEGVSGLYLGGGFPEVFAAVLADNRAAQTAVFAAIQAGMPTYAECGGLMYLCEKIVDFEQQAWSMVGIIPATVNMESRLTLGYRKAIALQSSPLINAGAMVWGHEFHRSRLYSPTAKPVYHIQGYSHNSLLQMEGWRSHQLHASYVHLHWGARPDLPQKFLASCQTYAKFSNL
jgi:cobyrinic acid a,c-diamide synthase